MKRRKRLQATEFIRAKELLSNGLSQKEVAEIIGRAGSVMSTISRSADFADYKRMTTAAWNKTTKLAKPIDITNGVSKTTNHFTRIEELMEELKGEVETVIELGIKAGVDKEMKSVAVELRELRNLQELAKTNNWASNLAKKFGI